MEVSAGEIASEIDGEGDTYPSGDAHLKNADVFAKQDGTSHTGTSEERENEGAEKFTEEIFVH